MSTHLEIWLRGHAKDSLRKISTKNIETYHPHVTIIRPFQTTINEEQFKNEIQNFCKDYKPLPFTLEGKGNFDGRFYYVPVTNARELEIFQSKLEKYLEPTVIFDEPKPEEQTHLHATADTKDIPYFEKTEQYMLRLTAIENKKIKFSYDFTQTNPNRQILSREESLDKTRWYNTVHQFTEQTGLLPTRQGYKKIR